MHPARVDDINPQIRPARHASYPPLAPEEVAYIPVWPWEDGGLKLQEGAVCQGAAGDEANTTALAKVFPCMRTSPYAARSRAMGIIKNLPSRCREEDVLDVISQLGFGSDVTAFNMPTRVGKGNRKLNRGFAFVYFCDERVCWRFVKDADGYRGFGDHSSGRAISVTFSLHFSSRSYRRYSVGSQDTEDELAAVSCQ
ncbi:unnamed protein product [Prorocentrum cordatum]|uniref:RRM domain-containing protein n=1 Tax=Prorocentrum cordatum TaxID=2364126 RepID=A0ABN9YED0_9DINO|nr:unnamed protein product [Polarella glacialis]